MCPVDAAPNAAIKVLIVEDEAGLRLVTTDCLVNEGGFDVVEAASAEEAVEILASESGIDCVFTDVRMPGRLDGIALARLVRQQYPNLPVIMTSGNMLAHERVQGVPVLTKPYDLDQLQTAIQGLVGKLRD